MARYCSPQDSVRTRWSPLYRATIFVNVVHGTKSMSCANNVLPVYMWPSPEKIPEGLCLRSGQVDTVRFSPETTETNGFSRVSSSLNRTAVGLGISSASRFEAKDGYGPVWISERGQRLGPESLSSTGIR